MSLIETLKQQHLIQTEENDSYHKQLKRLITKVKAAKQKYAMAIALFEAANKIDIEVLKFVAANHENGKAITKKLSLIDSVEFLNNRAEKLSYRLDLAAIGINGYLEISKVLGHYSFNKHFQTVLSIKEPKKAKKSKVCKNVKELVK